MKVGNRTLKEKKKQFRAGRVKQKSSREMRCEMEKTALGAALNHSLSWWCCLASGADVVVAAAASAANSCICIVVVVVMMDDCFSVVVAAAEWSPSMGYKCCAISARADAASARTRSAARGQQSGRRCCRCSRIRRTCRWCAALQSSTGSRSSSLASAR